MYILKCSIERISATSNVSLQSIPEAESYPTSQADSNVEIRQMHLPYPKRFKKSLQRHPLIDKIQGHVVPAVKSLCSHGHQYEIDGNIYNFNRSGVKQAKSRDDIKETKQWCNYWISSQNGHQVACIENELFKIHLNGENSDSILVYRKLRFNQGSIKIIRYVIIGVYTHYDIDPSKRRRSTDKHKDELKWLAEEESNRFKEFEDSDEKYKCNCNPFL